MNWLDTHKDAKEIKTIEEFKKYKGEKIYYKENDQFGVIDYIKDNGAFIYIPLSEGKDADDMIIDVGDLQTIECGMFKEHQLFVPYYNEEEIKKIEEATKKRKQREEKINHYETDYFGGVIPVYENQIKK